MSCSLSAASSCAGSFPACSSAVPSRHREHRVRKSACEERFEHGIRIAGQAGNDTHTVVLQERGRRLGDAAAQKRIDTEFCKPPSAQGRREFTELNLQSSGFAFVITFDDE